VPLGQGRLDFGLLLQEPVHGRIELVLVGIGHAQLASQRVGVEAAYGGQLGGRLQNPADDHRRRQLPLPACSGGDQPLHPQLAELTQHRQHIAVGQGTDDLKAVCQRPDLLAAKDGTHGIHGRRRQLGEVGQSPVLDLAAFAVGLADQHRAVLTAPLPARHNGYVHGPGRSLRHIRIVACLARLSSASNGYISRASPNTA